ncbi:phage tail protein [Kluyvera georgiana]|uniref:phage tail protein n=1 Tax=Kluyvera georgiana TaxID=73098 RepID=UPI003D95DB86
MTTKYFATLTNQGAARLANATALGTKLNITQMGVGDANGTLPTPSPTQTTLINQRRIAAINSLAVDDNDAGQIIVEQVIPENEGGFWIREIGLYDDTGVLIAVANCPETYKPLLTEGSGRTQTIRMILVVSSSASITLKVDPSVVLATRKYVDDGVIEVKSYVDKQVKAHEAKANPHSQYLLIKNALKEIADAGLADEVLENLGLGDFRFGAPLIGQRIDWPLELMPQEIWPGMTMEFIPYMAQSFDPVKYPLLSQLHPENKLPADMRGYAPRGWDNGRGIDIDRELMSEQDDAMRNFTGTFVASDDNSAASCTGVFSITKNYGTAQGGGAVEKLITFDPSKVVSTADENRMKNVAWNMIVRAK